MDSLTFIRTLTIEQAKTELQTNTITVKENPKKAGSFFMCNSADVVIGAVSSKVKQGFDKPVISEVSDGTSKFFLLHNKGEGGAATIMTL